MSPLPDILADAALLEPQRGERGMTHGRRTSTPVSRRAPADLDVLVLTDPRTGVLATLMHWAGRVRHELKLQHPPMRSIATETQTLTDHWTWALEQRWGSRMGVELDALADRLHEVRFGVPVRPCPVCSEPVRVDRFVTEHRVCLDATA